MSGRQKKQTRFADRNRGPWLSGFDLARVVWPDEKEPALRGRSEIHRAAVVWYAMSSTIYGAESEGIAR